MGGIGFIKRRVGYVNFYWKVLTKVKYLSELEDQVFNFDVSKREGRKVKRYCVMIGSTGSPINPAPIDPRR
jgi:hypothetical protein